MTGMNGAGGADGRTNPSARGSDLFLIGFLVLFLELACIRWFAANVIFLQFFTNIILLACFLGMSCGCLAARSKTDWLARFPSLAAGAALAAIAMLIAYARWRGLAIDVGGQGSPQEVFFGTEDRNPDVARFAVPIEVVAAAFFVLIALLFVGLGQALGQAFDAHPDRVRAYAANIGGSLAGIAGFSVLSFMQARPGAWFLVVAVGVGWLLWRRGQPLVGHVLMLAALLAAIVGPELRLGELAGYPLRWSPYYAVRFAPDIGEITVNTIGHQRMVRFDQMGASYSLIHLLQRASGGKPFDDVLVIGAGSGNDLDHALRYGAGRIDAVEIDPVIQDIGMRFNPDRPYQDARVVPHLDDGRHFLRVTDRKYDLVVYALVDSLILHSGYSNLRLESYLFTRQAFEDIHRVLKPGGIFVTYNYFRQGWIVERVAAMAEQVFGCKPTVISLPYRESLRASETAGFTALISDCGPGIATRLAQRPFWLNTVPARNVGVDGFTVNPDALPPSERADWQRIGPTALIQDQGAPVLASDEWPFPYLHHRLLPDLTLRSMMLLALVSGIMIWRFYPKTGAGGAPPRFDSRMFFLGAAFMLLETKAVVQLSLLFGSTWLVNSMVFFTVLVLILLSNLYVLKAPAVHLRRHYAALLLFLAVGIAVPFDVFLEGGVLWRYVLPCVVSLGPMFFAGVVFAVSFRESASPDQAFGANIAGSVLGGLSESSSMLLGFRYLPLLAMLFYALSLYSPYSRKAPPVRGEGGAP